MLIMSPRSKIDKYLMISLICTIFFMSCYTFINGIYNIIFAILNCRNVGCLNTIFYILIGVISILNMITSVYVFWTIRDILKLIKEKSHIGNYDTVKSISMTQIVLIMVSSMLFIFVQQNIDQDVCNEFWFSTQMIGITGIPINAIFYIMFTISFSIGIVVMILYFVVCCAYMCGIANNDEHIEYSQYNEYN